MKKKKQNEARYPEPKVIAKTIRRTKTNAGEKCKQYFYILGYPGQDTSIAIRKWVLANDNELYEKFGYTFVRRWKDKCVYFQGFSIKLNTLADITKWIRNI